MACAPAVGRGWLTAADGRQGVQSLFPARWTPRPHISCRDCGRDQGLSSRAGQAHLCAALPDKTLPRILEMEARDRIEAPVTPRHDPGCSLDAYMRLPAEMLSFIKMPAGASLRPLETPDLFELKVPELTLFSMWIRPVCTVTVTQEPGRLVLVSQGVDIRGSDELNQFGINEKVDLDVRCEFMWTDPEAQRGGNGHGNGKGRSGTPPLACNAHMRMWLDPPGPFAFLPRAGLKAAGDAALYGSLSLLMRSFVNNLADDYRRWAVDGHFRDLRALELRSMAHPMRSVPAGAVGVQSQDWD